jgi:hypothetical protein
MSAVAPALDDASIPGPVLGLAKTAPSIHEMHATEQKRWMIWFGTPVLIAALFVGATFGTGDAWWLSLALAALGVDILVLVWLAMSSDTNGVIGEVAPH